MCMHALRVIKIPKFYLKKFAINVCNALIYVLNICKLNAFHTVASYILAVESKKGTITIQRYSIENQKGAIAIDFVQW